MTLQRKPQVVIDTRMIGPIGHGIAEYVRDLVMSLLEFPERSFDLHLFIGSEMRAEDPLRGLPHVQVKAPFLSPMEMIEVPKKLMALQADLFLSPSFAAFPLNPVPTIYTVHDLCHLHFGSRLHKTYYRWILRPALMRAIQVCTVSNSSRQEIAKWLGWLEDQIAVVRNAIRVDIPPGNWEERLSKRGLKKYQYHFSLSSNKQHKNMPFLIRAYLSHVEKHPEAWPLVVSISQEQLGHPHPKIVCLGSLDDSDKTSLLAGAGAFYFPSLYEGFGRPPLEAAAMGVPIVVSKIAVHEEVLKNIPQKQLIPPDDLGLWSDAFFDQERAQTSNRAPQIDKELTRARMAQEMNRIILDALTKQISRED